MALVDLDFPEQLERFGVDTTLECFNCGTCTAICPLIHEHFPRKIIRYAQLGAKVEYCRSLTNSGAASTVGSAPIHVREKSILENLF